MRRAERVNNEWETPENFTWDHVALEVLMDIRAELRRLNALLHCPNFIAIPRKLDTIGRKIPARKKATKAKA